MRNLLAKDSKLPLYHQLYVLLRNRITNHSVLPGELLPGEQELCADFGVSRITAKRALNELADAGLVVRQQGKGTRVLPQKASASHTVSVEGWFENTSENNVSRVRVLEFDYRPAGEDVAIALQLSTHALIQRVVRIRYVDDEPMSYLVTYVPESIGRRYTYEDLSNTALLTLLELRGIKIASAQQTISAALASGQLATALEVPEGNPLIEVHRVIKDKEGKLIEFIRAYYRPDRYRIEMDITRVEEEKGNRWSAAGS